jgi:hypothetical protein
MVPLASMLSRIAAPIATAWPRLAAGALPLGVIAASIGCGPSLRLVEQSNLYFERCHAADLDAARTDAERRACWQAWRDHYDVGQSPDRDDYVRERLVMLDPQSGSAISLATPDDPMGQDPIGAGDAESSPTDVVDVPPEGPELSDTVGDRPPRPRRRPVAPRTRTSACGAGCEPAFVTCGTACTVGDRGCLDACRHIYRQCARGCF